MNLAINLFFTDIDFCKPKVMQGLGLNVNSDLSMLLRGAKVSDKILMF